MRWCRRYAMRPSTLRWDRTCPYSGRRAESSSGRCSSTSGWSSDAAIIRWRARSLAELVNAAWLTFEPRALLERDFSSATLPKPRSVIECESYIGFLRLLETTDMLGVVPRSTRPLSGDPLRIFQLSETLPTLTVGMFTRADSPLTPAAAALAKAVVASSRKLARRR